MPQKEQVLVTGASGFIASHCIIQLLDRGYRVRGTMRNMPRADEMRAVIERHAGTVAGLSFVEADLLEDTAWDSAMEGCAYVLHVASPVPIDTPKDPDALLRPARNGTLSVLRAARDHGVRRVVVTSSTAAVSYGEGGRAHADFTEEDWTDPDGPGVSPMRAARSSPSAPPGTSYALRATAWNLPSLTRHSCWVRSWKPISVVRPSSSAACSKAIFPDAPGSAFR